MIANATPSNSKEQPLVEEGPGLFRIAWRRKWVVLCVIGIAGAAGYLYFVQATPIHRSRAEVLIIKKDSRISSSDFKGADSGTAYGVYENTLATQMSLACSPLIVEKAVHRSELAKLTSFATMSPEEIVAVIITGLKAARAGDAAAPDPNVMELRYEAEDPADCRTVLEAVVKSYQSFLGHKYETVSDETLQLMRQVKDDLHKQLTSREQDYLKFRQKSPLLQNGDRASNPHEARAVDIENARSRAMVDTAQTKALVDEIHAALNRGGRREAIALLATATGPGSTTRSHRTQEPTDNVLLTALLEEQELLETFGKDHPKVKAVRQKIDLVRQHLSRGAFLQDTPGADFVTVYLQSLEEELNVGQRRLAELNRIFDEEHKRAKELAGVQAEDETHRNEIARTKLMFDQTMKRLDELNLIKDYGGIDAEVISPPSPAKLVRPKLPVVMGFAGILGLIAGVGMAYLIELGDKRFRSPEDVRRQAGVPVLGHIPMIAYRKSVRDRPDDGKRPLHPVVCAYHDPQGADAETFRALRTTLRAERFEPVRVIQVTSPTPGDGKSVVAANLAISLADSGKRVLLMDCDLRNPKVHEYMALDNTTGLGTLLLGNDGILSAVHETAAANLWAIPCGPALRNPAELLASPRFREILVSAREQFDLVLIDSPPLLAVSDPAIIAPLADGVLLVTRFVKHAREGITRAVEVLDLLGIHAMGVVMNGFGTPARYQYGLYGSGYYRHTYGDRRAETDEPSKTSLPSLSQ